MNNDERTEALELEAIRQLRKERGNDFTDQDIEDRMDQIEAGEA